MGNADIIINIIGNIDVVLKLLFDVLYYPFKYFAELNPKNKVIIYYMLFLISIYILFYIIKNKEKIYQVRH